MNTNPLKKALEEARPHIEAGLAEAESELERLEARREELLALIGQAKAALGLSDASPTVDQPGSHRLTLHGALEVVLREHGNKWMTPRELVDEVNARSLYRMRDGSPVDVGQVHARTKNYNDVFEKDGSRIRLRSAVAGDSEG